MADVKPAVSQSPEPKLIEAIVESGKRAFNPAAGASEREAGRREFDELVERAGTWNLLLALNPLIKPNVLPPWLKEPLMQILTRLPLRPDGVRATMEFVFSVHPSNGGTPSDTAAAQKQGANITHEAVAVAAKLLSSVPTSMTPQDWFNGIADQLFQMLDGDAGKDLARPAAQIVGFGILGKKQFGAPGTAGWDAFVQPLIESVNPSLRLPDTSSIKLEQPDAIIDLTQDQVLVTPETLIRSLQRLKTLIVSTPSPGLCRRILRPIISQIWALTSWVGPPANADQQVCQTARMLLHTYLQLFGKVDSVAPLIRNMLCQGSVGEESPKWTYRLTTLGEIQIVAQQKFTEAEAGLDLDLGILNQKAAILAEILISACSKDEVSSIFLHLLQKWIGSTNRSSNIKLSTGPEEGMSSSPHEEIGAITLLQMLMEKAPEKLVSHFDQLIELVCQVLKADRDSSLEDDMIVVVLSLLNLVITAPRFQKTDLAPGDLKIIEESLEALSAEDRSDVSPTAKNLAMLLRFRDEVDQPEERPSAPSARHIEDRRTYNLAMNYITGGDNPPPVVSEGINLLSGLVVAQSPILDIPAINVLMSNLLSGGEDFINLRVIKVFTQLADKHPRSTVQELLDHYLDAHEKASTDVRLRFGEALLQVIERLGDTFSGDVATQASETLLSIAGRRGYRPKTMAKQARREKLRKLEAHNSSGGRSNQEADESQEELDEEEQARNDILAQIIQGWESKRGAEDVRMRTSALSILGSALEVNIAGIGPSLVSASVDLCVNILTMEPELEKGILRRAAVMVILGFVKALDKARESKRSLGFGLMDESREDISRALQYVAATDNDGLVKQHAADVIESLENWQMAALLPRMDDTGTPGLMTLAGLHVNPGTNLMSATGRPRPRIEEIE